MVFKSFHLYTQFSILQFSRLFNKFTNVHMHFFSLSLLYFFLFILLKDARSSSSYATNHPPLNVNLWNSCKFRIHLSELSIFYCGLNVTNCNLLSSRVSGFLCRNLLLALHRFFDGPPVVRVNSLRVKYGRPSTSRPCITHNMLTEPCHWHPTQGLLAFLFAIMKLLYYRPLHFWCNCFWCCILINA